MKKKYLKFLTGTVFSLMLTSQIFPITASAHIPINGWVEINGEQYWYENDVLQGTEGRGKEIYDQSTNAWYWLDAAYGGRKAVSKDVYQPYTIQGKDNIGKWVRYDENGHMIKGWDATENGLYYFDPITGAMVKGETRIECGNYVFDETTGIALHCSWHETNDGKYWYENGRRQGTEGRGKEIYDPASNAWYWLDAADGGKMAVSKEVYQESDGGKWVRYDSNGHMIKGWYTNQNGTYYYYPTTGAMAKGTVAIEGVNYYFNETTGILEGNDKGSSPAETYAQEVVSFINVERAKEGLSELVLNPNVQAAAQVRAKELDQFFSNNRPNNTSCFTALGEQGVYYTSAAENIAYGYNSAYDVVAASMNNETQRKNILNSKFTSVGVGCYTNSDGRKYWVQLFIY